LGTSRNEKQENREVERVEHPAEPRGNPSKPLILGGLPPPGNRQTRRISGYGHGISSPDSGRTASSRSFSEGSACRWHPCCPLAPGTSARPADSCAEPSRLLANREGITALLTTRIGPSRHMLQCSVCLLVKEQRTKRSSPGRGEAARRSLVHIENDRNEDEPRPGEFDKANGAARSSSARQFGFGVPFILVSGFI
jgi:hypothetical protein